MNESEVQSLSNEALANLELWVRTERDRRSRLSLASAGIADMLKKVKADGGNPSQVVSEACAAASVPTPESPDTPDMPEVPEVPEVPSNIPGIKSQSKS